MKKKVLATIISAAMTATILAGCAGAAAEVIDRVPDDQILGTIAGDNTILLIVDMKEHVEFVMNMIKEVIS